MSRVPRLRVLAWLIGLPGVRPLVSALYRASVLRRLRASGRVDSIPDARFIYLIARPAGDWRFLADAEPTGSGIRGT